MTKDVNWQSAPDDEIVCYCKDVAKETIVAAIADGATGLVRLQETTGAGKGGRCKELNPRGRCCHSDLLELIGIYSGKERQGDCCSCCE